MEKLQLLSSCKPSVDNEAQTSHAEREDFKHEVQQIIQRIEEAKEKDYIIWHNKIQDDVLNAVQLLNAEYSRIESSLLKHNEKLELLIKRVLEDLRFPTSKQVPHDESSKDTSATYEALKLVEELTLLNAELKEQYLQLRKQLENRQEELRRKSETLKFSSDTGSGEASKTERELRKENMFLKEQIKDLLSQDPQKSRELWDELKDENAKLKEEIDTLLEHIKQEEVRKVAIQESNQEDGTHAENFKLKKQGIQLKDEIRKTKACCDKGVMINLSMFTPEKKPETQMKMKVNQENNNVHKIEMAVQDQGMMTEPMMWEQTPELAQEFLLELRNENIRLKNQIDLLVEHIKEKEDMENKETMTETNSGAMQPSGELQMENLKLKQQIILLTENRKQNYAVEQETMTEPVVYELPEQYKDLLNKLKIENVNLKDQVHLFEEHLKHKEALQNRGIMTDPLVWEEEQRYKDENVKLRANVLFLQNKIRQHNIEFRDAGTDLRTLLEEDESEVGEASWCVSRLLTDRDSPNKALLVEDQSLQEAFSEKPAIQKTVVIEKLLVKNRELNQELDALRFKLEEFYTKTHPLKAEMNNVQTMTDPDIELVHISMENAALQAHLQQLSKDYKKKREDLERTLVLLRESREASSLLLKEARDANAHENTLLKKELEEMKRKLKHQEQEIFNSKTNAAKEHQPAKITELCNLLDHLQKENTELREQLKKMLIEKEEKEGIKFDKVVTNNNLDSLTHLLSMGCPVSVDEAQQRKGLGIMAGNVEIVDMAVHSQTSSAFTVNNIPESNQDEPKSSVRTYDRCESESYFSDIPLLNKTKQNSPASNAESKCPVLINYNGKEQELQAIDLTKSQLSKYSGPPLEFTSIDSKENEVGCSLLMTNSQHPTLYCSNEKNDLKDMPSESCKEQASKLPVTSAQASGISIKHQQSYKNNSSSSSEAFSDVKCCQNQIPCGLSSESTNSDLGSVSQEPVWKANFRPIRDAATNTTPSVQNLELQRELQLEKDKSKKYQQNMKKLKSDVQLLKNKLGESRKQGKIESNLALKQNNANNSSLLAGVQSPSHYDPNMAEFQRQVAELEQKVREENSMRFALEVQINKMRYELQEKLQLEKELGILRNRLEKDFVSRYELEQLRNSYEVALSRAKYEAEMAARDDLNGKLCQINTFIEKQVQEQTRLSQLRNTTEAQMKQDFQETRLKLLSELAKVQASLQAKGEEEKELREKCDKLTRECENRHEIRRKKLIEKSYNVNLAPNSNLKEKELNSKGYMLDMRSPMHLSSAVQPAINPISSPAVTVTTHVADAWQTEHPFSHILRRELERSIRKHTRTDSLTEHPSSSSPQTASEEHLELLKKKYFLH